MLSNYRFLIFGCIALLVGAFGLYRWGYSSATQKYEIEFAMQQQRILDLQAAESKIEKEIVTVYQDRVKIVTKYRDRIIEVTPDVLSEESKQCSIGSGFIGLHNAAASNQGLPNGTGGSNASSINATATSE